MAVRHDDTSGLGPWGLLSSGVGRAARRRVNASERVRLLSEVGADLRRGWRRGYEPQGRSQFVRFLPWREGWRRAVPAVAACDQGIKLTRQAMQNYCRRPFIGRSCDLLRYQLMDW